MERGRILLTGATGFVGRRVLGSLLEAGREVTAAVRNAASLPGHPNQRVVEVREIGPRTDWDEALADADAVVHLAAHVHVAPERAGAETGRFDTVNHLGSTRLFDEAAARDVRLFVFASSVTVLGAASPPGRPFDEQTCPRPQTPYAASKLAAERALRAKAGEGPARLVILRLPLVCGPGAKGNLGALARLAALPIPLPLGGIGNRRTLLSLDNLASAVLAVLSHPEPAAGTFLLGDHAALSTTDIVRHLRAGAGRAPLLVPAPVALLARLAGLAGRAGAAQRLFGDLQLDSDGFRRAFAWQEVTDTASSLRAAAAALGRAV